MGASWVSDGAFRRISPVFSPVNLLVDQTGSNVTASTASQSGLGDAISGCRRSADISAG